MIGKKSRKIRKKSRKIRKKHCLERGKRKPRPIQRRVINYINRNNSLYDGLLIVHGTGCGKTLSAVIASQCYLDKYPNNHVIFLAPASLITNFEKELNHYGVTNHGSYKAYSFSKFASLFSQGRAPSCKKSLLIIDEAHNLRNYGSNRGKAGLACAMQAHKKLLLTATPFINTAKDFINIINILHGKEIAGHGGQNRPFTITAKLAKKSLDNIKLLLKGRVDYVPSCRGHADFPGVTEHVTKIPMSKAYEKIYDKVTQGLAVGGMIIPNPTKFLHGFRKAVNKAGTDKYYSAKLKKTMELIKLPSGKIQKSVIFTNWIDFGVKAISKFMKSHGIPFKVFRGGLSIKKKDEIVREFNADKFPILIVTRAGGEGLDLKKVRNIIILDPVWHNAGTEQIIGRVVRYKSHSDLPKSERHVNVWKMVLTYPRGKPGSTGDQTLYSIIARKKKDEDRVSEILKQVAAGTPQVVKYTKPASLKKYTKHQLELMNITSIKKICRLAYMNKKSSGKSLSDYKKSDKANLIKDFLRHVKHLKSRK